MDGEIKRQGLATVGAAAEAWMQRQGFVRAPGRVLTKPLTFGGVRAWVRSQERAATLAAADMFADARAGYLLECRRFGEDARMRSAGECWETWLFELSYVPAFDGGLERRLQAAFVASWRECESEV